MVLVPAATVLIMQLYARPYSSENNMTNEQPSGVEQDGEECNCEMEKHDDDAVGACKLQGQVAAMGP